MAYDPNHFTEGTLTIFSNGTYVAYATNYFYSNQTWFVREGRIDVKDGFLIDVCTKSTEPRIPTLPRDKITRIDDDEWVTGVRSNSTENGYIVLRREKPAASPQDKGPLKIPKKGVKSD